LSAKYRTNIKAPSVTQGAFFVLVNEILAAKKTRREHKSIEMKTLFACKAQQLAGESQRGAAARVEESQV